MYSDCLRAGRSGDRIPVGVRFSAPVQISPEAHPASCTMGTGSFLGVSVAGAWRWPHTPSSADVKKSLRDFVAYERVKPTLRGKLQSVLPHMQEFKKLWYNLFYTIINWVPDGGPVRSETSTGVSSSSFSFFFFFLLPSFFFFFFYIYVCVCVCVCVYIYIYII